MKLEIHHVHVHRTELAPHVRDQLEIMIGRIKMISTQVQAVLDRAKQNNSLVASVDLGMKALSKQVSDLQAQIASLPAGNVLSDEDKAALVESAGDLDTSIATLQNDIPANTPQGATTTAPGSAGAANPAPQGAATGQPASPPPPDAPASAPSTDPAADASAHQADSDAAAQAKPLAGTSPAS